MPKLAEVGDGPLRCGEKSTAGTQLFERAGSLTIIRANRLVPIREEIIFRLTPCDSGLPRAGPCSPTYVVRLDGSYDERRKALMLVADTAGSERR